MSKTVRGMILALGLVALAGCDSQAVGQRCQATSDCNTDTDVCVDEFRRPAGCMGGINCICCPSDRTAAQAIPACVPVTTVARDAGAD